jgi:hypothetical protein
MRNCTGDEGRPFEVGNQVLVPSHRKLLSSKAMVVLCQEGAKCLGSEGGRSPTLGSNQLETDAMGQAARQCCRIVASINVN